MLIDRLPPDLRSLIEQGEIDVSEEILVSLAMYRGPYPPPQILAEYERLFPGWGQKMLELTETQIIPAVIDLDRCTPQPSSRRKPGPNS